MGQDGTVMLRLMLCEANAGDKFVTYRCTSFVTATCLHTVVWRLEADSGVPRGVWGVQPPRPGNSEGPPKNRAKLNPICENCLKKIAEFRTPTPQDVRKKKAVKF